MLKPFALCIESKKSVKLFRHILGERAPVHKKQDHRPSLREEQVSQVPYLYLFLYDYLKVVKNFWSGLSWRWVVRKEQASIVSLRVDIQNRYSVQNGSK